VTLVLAVPINWMFPDASLAARSASLEVRSRVIPQAIGAFTLAVLLAVYALTGADPGAYGFRAGRALLLLVAYMGCAIVLWSPNYLADGYMFSKTLVWTVGAVVFYRLALAGSLTAGDICLTARALVLLASYFTIRICLDPASRIGQNADASVLLWCLPLLLLAGPSALTFVFIALAAFAVILTIKRGTMLAMFLSLAAYAVMYTKAYPQKTTRWRTGIMVAMIGFCIVGTVVWQYDALTYRMGDFRDHRDIGSGRATFYRALVRAWWYEYSLWDVVFGRGFFTVPQTLGKVGRAIYAHSDWLEILHDMGLVGASLFMALHVALLLTVTKALRLRSRAAPSLLMGYCIFALRNVYSQVTIGTTDTVLFSMLLGYASAKLQHQEHKETLL